ncbi:UNVERIFIED_CONTAM: hypothetical protein Sradi_0454200 [Sesamum radiatum]|uniref:CCHC-type domain-containing protein n=1 Tax=Sesamum radiatum TaxID=300843 RepID=A0AAW2W7T0_SESRA
MDDSGRSWGSSLRIRVGLDVTTPLKRVLKIRTTSGGEHMICFSYERLPNFCYICGVLGHIAKFCETQFHEGFEDPGDDLQYGPWLREPVQTQNWKLTGGLAHSPGNGNSTVIPPPEAKRGQATFREFGSKSSSVNREISQDGNIKAQG